MLLRAARRLALAACGLLLACASIAAPAVEAEAAVAVQALRGPGIVLHDLDRGETESLDALPARHLLHPRRLRHFRLAVDFQLADPAAAPMWALYFSWLREGGRVEVNGVTLAEWPTSSARYRGAEHPAAPGAGGAAVVARRQQPARTALGHHRFAAEPARHLRRPGRRGAAAVRAPPVLAEHDGAGELRLRAGVCGAAVRHPRRAARRAQVPADGPDLARLGRHLRRLLPATAACLGLPLVAAGAGGRHRRVHRLHLGVHDAGGQAARALVHALHAGLVRARAGPGSWSTTWRATRCSRPVSRAPGHWR